MSESMVSAKQQYERKLARQKQLDMMEAAAAGQSFDSTSDLSAASSPTVSSSPTSAKPTVGTTGGGLMKKHSSYSSGPPQGAIESARRFLWDEDEDAETGGGTMQTLPFEEAGLMKGMNNSASNVGFGSRMANTVRGALSFSGSSTKHLDHDADLKLQKKTRSLNLAPRSTAAFDPSNSSRNVHKPSASSKLGDCCVGTWRGFQDVCFLLCDYTKAWIHAVKQNPKNCVYILGAQFGLGILIFIVVSLVRTNGNLNRGAVKEIQNQERYDALRDVILESKFTTKDVLEDAESAPNFALRWLTDTDPGQVAVDDDALLQRYALATLYYSSTLLKRKKEGEDDEDEDPNDSNDRDWKSMDHWMTGKGICMWFGVSCPPHLKEGVNEVHYNANADVLYLNLTENNMHGQLPSELAALENLESLDVGKNQLTGTIPKSFATFQVMREIYLEDNLMTGTIHSELGAVTTMRDFFIGTNKFVGTIPPELSSLTDLRALALDENLLQGTIPDSIYDQCTNLVILYLDANGLTGSISPDISKLSKLSDLRLRNNALTGSIPDSLHNLAHLELLYLDNNKLVGPIPPSIGNMTRIQEIQIYKNELTGDLPNEIGSLAKLKVLYADNNKLQGTLPASYGTLNDLRVLYVFNNAMGGTLPSELGQLDALVDFQLYNNKFSGKLPSHLAGCYELQKFEAQDNRLTGTIPAEFGSMENLQRLKLYRNQFTGSVPREVCDAKNNFQLGFIATDCNAHSGGKVACNCCSSCYP